MEVRWAADRWARTLRATWPANEVGPLLALYADGALYHDLPRHEGESAVEHMRRVYALGDPGPEVWIGEPLVDRDCAAISWWAVIRFEGSPRTFSGTTWASFDADGLIVDEHDTWMAAEARIEPWPGWA